MATVKGIGQPLPLTDDQLEEEAEITEATVLAMIERWHNAAPRKFKTLVDSRPTSADQVPDEKG